MKIDAVALAQTTTMSFAQAVNYLGILKAIKRAGDFTDEQMKEFHQAIIDSAAITGDRPIVVAEQLLDFVKETNMEGKP